MKRPETPHEKSEVESQHLGTAEQSMSEIRERFFNDLSQEQKEVLKSAELTLEPSTQNTPTLIRGEVTIEGQKHTIELVHPNIAAEGDRAVIDGEKFSGRDAKELFDFYYPIARAIFESSNFPTPESEALYREKLKEKLLGR